MTKAKAKPRARKPKAETMPEPPAHVCPECQRLLEIEERTKRRIEETIEALQSTVKLLGGHNYVSVLSYLNSAMQHLSPAVDEIQKLYHEQETARRGKM